MELRFEISLVCHAMLRTIVTLKCKAHDQSVIPVLTAWLYVRIILSAMAHCENLEHQLQVS